MKLAIDAYVPEFKCTLAEELLRPTEIYVKAINSLRTRIKVKGMAHITGGGMPGNIPRTLPEGLGAEIRKGSWPLQPVFEVIQRMGKVPDLDMKNTFNMGIGYVVVVDGDDSARAVEILGKNGIGSCIIGTVFSRGDKGVRYVD